MVSLGGFAGGLSGGAAINIIIHAKDEFSKEFKNANTGMDKLKKSASQATKVAALGITVLTALAVKSASDFEEIDSKFKVVFKSIDKKAKKSSDNLRKNFGLSEKSAKELLGTTGDLLTGFGFADEAALDLSNQVNELAVDLASFTNIEGGAERASEALTKALLGEREQVKSLGIAILEVDVNKKIAILESQGMTFETKRQAKAMATLIIAQEQSKNAIGDWARTQGSAANQTKLLKENITDVATTFGSVLLPAVTSVLNVMNDLIDSFNNLPKETKDLISKGILVTGAATVGAAGIIKAMEVYNEFKGSTPSNPLFVQEVFPLKGGAGAGAGASAGAGAGAGAGALGVKATTIGAKATTIGASPLATIALPLILPKLAADAIFGKSGFANKGLERRENESDESVKARFKKQTGRELILVTKKDVNATYTKIASETEQTFVTEEQTVAIIDQINPLNTLIASEVEFAQRTEDLDKRLQEGKISNVAYIEAQANLNNRIESSRKEADAAGVAMEAFADSISAVVDKMVENAKRIDMGRTLVGKQKRFEGGGTSTTFRDVASGQVSTTVFDPSETTAGRAARGLKPFNDFIARPGQPMRNFSPDDTIIGVKNTSSLGGGNITINIENVNGVDPTEMAIALESQLSSMIKLN